MIISSPLFNSKAKYAKCRADVALVTEIANFELTNLQTMMMGTAGFTALLCSFAIKAREELLMGEKVKDVLVTGATGGVGCIAVMILSKFGYKVTALTGKKDKKELVKHFSKNEKTLIITSYYSGLNFDHDKNLIFLRLQNENDFLIEQESES